MRRFKIYVAKTAFSSLLMLGTLNGAAIATAQPPHTANVSGAVSSPSSAPPISSASPAAEDIRDIKPPFHIPSSWLWLECLSGAIAFAAICYGLWYWRKRRMRLQAKSPFELALEQLEAARSLMQPENAREFSIRVSEIVRCYIEKRFGTRAANRTTEEFLRDRLEESESPLSKYRPLLSDFLNHCDLAKFARWILSESEMEAMLDSASWFVLETGNAGKTPDKTSVPISAPTQSDAPVAETGVGQKVQSI